MRVTVCALAFALLAIGLSAVSGEQHALLSRLHKLKRTRQQHRVRAASAPGIPTVENPVDLLGTDWSKVDLMAGPVTVPKGSLLWHSSDAVIDFSQTPQGIAGFWLTPDLSQSVAAGVNKVKEFNGALPVVVHGYTTNRDLTLLPLPACARAGLAFINNIVARANVKPWPKTLMGNPSLGLHQWVAQVCKVLAKLKVDGWRSPWDQDEVMLCVEHQNALDAVAFTPVECPFALLSKNLATHTYWTGQKRLDIQEKSFPDACGKPVDPKDKALPTNDALFSYESYVHWADTLGQAKGTEQWLQWVTDKAKAVPMVNVNKVLTDYKGKRIDRTSLEWFCPKVTPKVKPQPKPEAKEHKKL